MKTVAIISGKGGTGKTSLATAFAELARPVVFADCDVDAANAALLLPGEVTRDEPFEAGFRAVIDPVQCAFCSLCVETCPAGAIRLDGHDYRVDPLSCEGCGVCELVCEFSAISERTNRAGRLQVLESKTGPLVHGLLRPAQDNSGKLVARVREVAREIAAVNGAELCLVDGPPGIGCPVHAALTGVDLAILVTEPTPSGEHDLGRALELCHHFQIPARVIINKADIDPQVTDRLKAQTDRAPVVGHLPFLPAVPERLAQGEGLLAIAALRPILAGIWTSIENVLDATEQPS